ncbi:MAG: GntR family transcriptional regulator [Burkholderiales bacterium]
MASSPLSPLAAQIASQVIGWLQGQGLGVGAHLSEQRLADAFRVSRSPVRRALALLEVQGIVAQEPHRGYFVRKLPTAASVRGTARAAGDPDENYLRIADDRLAGRLAGDITESALMRGFGLPRRELQRILHRMEKEGWVERKPGHGWSFVALPDTVEAHGQSYRFRMLFEPAALLEPGFRIVKNEFDRIRRDQQMLLDGGIARLSRAKLFELGSDFHETLMGFSGNRFMTDAIKRVNGMRRLLEYRAHYDRERFAGQCREHLQLLELLERGSREDAARFLKRHLDVVRAIKTEGAAPQVRAQL